LGRRRDRQILGKVFEVEQRCEAVLRIPYWNNSSAYNPCVFYKASTYRLSEIAENVGYIMDSV